MPSDNNLTEAPKRPGARICVAKVAAAHGVKGLVKLHVFADNIDLLGGDLFTVETGDQTLSLKLKNATAKHWLAEIDGVTDRDAAEALRGTNLYIDKSALPEPDENEFYASDLIGLPAIDKDNKEIGKVVAVENFGAGDLLEIKPAGRESFYLPFNDDTIPDIREDKIIVAIPEGLLE
jgi:16S rRNA processing protein RimM